MNLTKMSKRERARYISLAKDLCYSHETIKKIERAKTEEEAERALVDARHSM